jgi:Zn-finger nucleic acid-binding protein
MTSSLFAIVLFLRRPYILWGHFAVYGALALFAGCLLNKDSGMDCPVCSNEKLVMSERQGIEIDYCPSCRGVWLDRGELDKIIEKSAAASQPVPQAASQPPSQPAYQPAPQQMNAPYQEQQRPPQGFGHSQQSQGYPQHGHYKKKRKGFLGELFDFD